MVSGAYCHTTSQSELSVTDEGATLQKQSSLSVKRSSAIDNIDSDYRKMAQLPEDQDRERLQQHFSSEDAPDRVRLREHFSSENTPDRWDALWKDNFSPWDRGTPNPALVDLLRERKDLLGDSTVTDANGVTRKKRALVPGCGRGYDVLLLASFGYDAVGVEGSETAISTCKKLEMEGTSSFALQEGVETRGAITFLLGDFFSAAWEAELPFRAIFEGFDLIYDYTFFCALPPSTRPNWALRMVELLAKTGTLVTLEFPLYKDPLIPGPPWGLRDETYVQHLANPGEAVQYSEDGFVIVPQTQKRDAGLVRKARWKPDRTHEIGQGTDYISLWMHST